MGSRTIDRAPGVDFQQPLGWTFFAGICLLLVVLPSPAAACDKRLLKDPATFRSGYKGLFALGVECQRFDKWQQALLFLDEALKLNPREGGKVSFPGTENVEYLPHYYLARVLYQLGNYEKSLQAIADAESGGQGLVTLRYNRKKWKELQEIREEMLGKSLPFQTGGVQAELAAVETRWIESKRSFESLEDIEWETVTALLGGARGRLDLAAAANDFGLLNEARALGREAWSTLLDLEQRAVEAAARRKSEEARIAYERAVSAIAGGACSRDAIRWLETLVETELPPDADDLAGAAWLRLAEANLLCEELDEAARALAAARGTDVAGGEELGRLADRLNQARAAAELRGQYELVDAVLARKGCPAEAIDVLEALADRPEMIEAAHRERRALFVPLAEAWLRCNDLERSLEYLKRAGASRVEPAGEIARVERARAELLRARGEAEIAAEQAELLATLYDAAARVLAVGGCQPSAIEQFAGMVRLWPEDAVKRGLPYAPYLKLAVAHLACGNLGDAENAVAQSRLREAAPVPEVEAVERTISAARADRVRGTRMAEASTDYLAARFLLELGHCSPTAIQLLESARRAAGEDPATLTRYLPSGTDFSPMVELARAYQLCGDAERAAQVLDAMEPRSVSTDLVQDLRSWLRYTDELRQLPSYALLVGVSEYEHWTPLPSVPAELREVREILVAHGFENPTVVLDPTFDQLDRAIREFFSGKGLKTRDSRLIFYFAGHGETRRNREMDMGYLVPADAPERGDDLSYVGKLIPMNDFETQALEIESRHALFVFDSCFAGTVFDAVGSEIGRRVDQPLSDVFDKDARLFITAGQKDEAVPNISSFKKALIEALGGRADSNRDGLVLGTEIGEYVKAYGSTASTTPAWGMMREGGFDQGDVPFYLLSAPTTQLDDDPGLRGRIETIEHWRSILERGDRVALGAYVRNGRGPLFSAVAEGLLQELTRGYEVNRLDSP
jgi:tetratricopeptide (TPR) repeat protein